MAAPTGTLEPRSPKRSPLRTFVVISGIGLVASAALATYRFGRVAGEEFCPHRFNRRSFVYYEIPLVHLQITPIWRDDTTNDLERYLISQGLLGGEPAPTPRWDLVRAHQAGVTVEPGDAEILCAYLDSRAADETFAWRVWSGDHLEQARVLWPAVARMARHRLYLLTPELFRLAEQAKDPATLRSQIDQTLRRRLAELAGVQQALGNADAAQELRQLAEPPPTAVKPSGTKPER